MKDQRRVSISVNIGLEVRMNYSYPVGRLCENTQVLLGSQARLRDSEGNSTFVLRWVGTVRQEGLEG